MKKFFFALFSLCLLAAAARSQDAPCPAESPAIPNQESLEAAKEFKKIRQRQRRTEECAEDIANQQRDTKVRASWSETLRANPACVKLSAPQLQPAVAMTRSNDFEMRRKLQKIILPEIEFASASLEDAAFFLTTQSRKLDPQKNGVSFLVQEEAKSQAKPVTLSLRDIPLGEALRYITQLAGVKFRVEEQAVIFTPLSPSSRVLVTREFVVRRQFVFLDDAKDVENSKKKQKSKESELSSIDENVKKTLIAHGVAFEDPPPEIPLSNGGVRKPRADEYPTASYSAATGVLLVRNTQEQMDYIEQLILSDLENQGKARLIKVETHIFEINQTDLDEISFNWSFNGGTLNGNPFIGDVSGTHARLSATAAQTRLGGADSLPGSNIENLISGPQTTSQNTLAIKGLLDGVSFTAVLNALNQKKSANLLSAPTIMMNSGSSDAVIEVAREFIYPTAFEAPQVVLRRKTNYSTSSSNDFDRVIIPAWPSQFDEQGRKVGVCIKVKKAQADQGNRRIALELEPEITTFDGFIDYGSPLFSVPTQIKVPIFTVRAFDEGFRLDVLDGYTMVLGGLIREEIQNIEDKVPFLGDIPLAGNLFRGKANRAVRKNLLLFVTARILQPNGDLVNP
ncbi:MAG: hypothetical protein V1746_01535 [bacterium]